MTIRSLSPSPLIAALVATLGAAPVAWAGDEPVLAPYDAVAQDDADAETPAEGEDAEAAEPAEEKKEEARQKPPQLPPDAKIAIDFVDAPTVDVIKHFAEVMGRTFILTDDIKGEITIISHSKVSRSAAWEAFVSALAVEGYTLVTTGNMTKVVPITEAAGAPVGVYEGGNIPYTDNFVTQIIQLESVSVSDVSSVVKELAGQGSNIIAYAPTNTLIISGPANNIRRVYRIISKLDVAAPKAKLAMVTLEHAGRRRSGSSRSSTGPPTAPARRPAAGQRPADLAQPAPRPEAGHPQAGRHLGIGLQGGRRGPLHREDHRRRADELAAHPGQRGPRDVIALIKEIDVDVDPTSYQIRVVYLEHAKAEDVGRSSRTSPRAATATAPAAAAPGARAGAPASGGAGGPTPAVGPMVGKPSAVAAFDSGMRIAGDENTNALVIISTRDEFDVISEVIEKLDMRRRQVFVEAVILGLSTNDDSSFGLAVHGGSGGEDGSINIASAQLGASSILGASGFASADVLSGMAVGVFGPSVEIDAGDLGTLSVPGFGVVLNALQSSSSVNILSTPNILTMDNEEAKIVVGRNVPFPVGTSQNNPASPSSASSVRTSR